MNLYYRTIATTMFFIGLFSISLAQSEKLIGKWQVTDDQGNTIVLSIEDDMTWGFDYNGDGNSDIKGKMEVVEDKVFIEDTEGSDCIGVKAIYSYILDGDSATFTKVEDPCTSRDTDSFTVTKVK